MSTRMNEASRRPQFESVHDLRFRHRLIGRNLSISLALELPEYAYLGEIPATIHISRTPLRDLERITLRDLRIDKIARGKYLILRTLEPAYKIISIITVVEDHEGNAITFCIFNYDSAFNTNLDDIFPVGTVFVLKEPFCKLSPAETGLIRCDCPSNVIVLYEGHPMFGLANSITWINDIGPEDVPKPSTPLEWATRGDQLSKSRKFVQASRCYSIALQGLEGLPVAQESFKMLLRLNLSAMYFLAEFFENALELVEKLLENHPENRQALNLAGRSYYCLRNFKKAAKHFRKCQTLQPGDEYISALLAQAKARLLEQKTGEFDMYRLHLMRNFNSQADPECADFYGPVKVAEIPGKGRGVVSMQDLEPGTLLVVSKALRYSRDPENFPQIDVVHGEVSNNISELIRLADLCQLILKNPQTFAPMVYNLFDGNQIHCHEPSELFCDPDTKSEPIVDVERIRNILKNNCFNQPSGNDEQNSNDRFKMPDSFCISNGNRSGLFVFPSFFNHSCRPNAVWQIFNDVMFIRTIQFIKANEEVSVPYFSWELEYPKRRVLCQQRGFVCACQLCMEDRETSISLQSKRESIVSQVKEMVAEVFTEDSARVTYAIIGMHQLINELGATYQDSESLKAVMASNHVYLWLAKAYTMDTLHDPWKKIEEMECYYNTLKLFGFDPVAMYGALENERHLITPNAYLDPQVLFAISRLIFIHNSFNDFKSCRIWAMILHALERIYSGGNKKVTMLKYEQIKVLLSKMLKTV